MVEMTDDAASIFECEQCGEPCPDGVRACPFSGLMLCAECAYDQGIQAEERHYVELDAEDDVAPPISEDRHG